MWAIYLLDRLLDARKIPSFIEPARHRYYRRHSKLMTALLAVVISADAAIAILWLRPAVLHDGLIPLAGVLAYLAIFHIAGELAPHPCTRWLARTYLLWVPAAVIVCAVLGRNEWYASIAVSAGACAVLFWFGRRLPLEARRALVDGVLLSPLLFLIPR